MLKFPFAAPPHRTDKTCAAAALAITSGAVLNAAQYRATDGIGKGKSRRRPAQLQDEWRSIDERSGSRLDKFEVAGATGLESATSGVTGRTKALQVRAHSNFLPCGKQEPTPGRVGTDGE